MNEALRTITTRVAQEKILREAGLEGETLEVALKLGAYTRHKWRVEETRRAAENFARPRMADELGEQALQLAIQLLFLLDLAGSGGHMGLNGAGTSRHEAFQNCGTGRKHAGDGAAWMAALDGQRTRIEVVPSEDGTTLIVPDGENAISVKVGGGIAPEWLIVPFATNEMARKFGIYDVGDHELNFDAAARWAKLRMVATEPPADEEHFSQDPPQDAQVEVTSSNEVALTPRPRRVRPTRPRRTGSMPGGHEQ